MRLVLATANADKIQEINSCLKKLPIEILTYRDFPAFPEVAETGKTLEENAKLKARSIHRATGLPALADDTGLEVDALGGAPGVYSSRFAGENATYADNNRKLLSLLASIPLEKRTARFRCVLALALGPDDLRTAEGKIEGVITDQPRGSHGFGYDPIFSIPHLKRTFAELSTAEKNQISHRGLALKKMAALLARLVNAPAS